MGGFAFQVACLRPAANEPLFYSESTDGPKFVSKIFHFLNCCFAIPDFIRKDAVCADCVLSQKG